MTKSINIRIQDANKVVWITNANVPINEVKIVVGSAEVKVMDLKDIHEAFSIVLPFEQFKQIVNASNEQMTCVDEYLKKLESKPVVTIGEEEKPKKKKK